MQVLVNAHAAELLEARAAAIRPAVELVRLTVDGSLLVDGRERARAEVHPEVAYASAHVLTDGSAPAWLSLLEQLTTLRWLQSPAAGHLDFYDALLERGIRITGAHVNAIPIAEYVMGAVLTQLQRVEEWTEARASRAWRPHQFDEISGNTWLIVGVGAIGAAVAVRASAFDAHTIGVRRAPRGDEPVHEMIGPHQVHEVLPRCDVVVLAAPHTPETTGLVDAEFLDAMKPGAILVNVARGALVDEVALIGALDRDHLRCAILDVFATEPLPADSPLWTHPRIVVTPHSSAGGLGRHARAADLFVENLARYRSGRSLLHEVGRPSGEAPDRAGVAPTVRFATLNEIEVAARARLEPEVFDFIAGGAGDEATLAANEHAFSRVSFRPRLLTGAAPPDTSTSFVGVALDTPLLVAPFAGDSLLHTDGYRAVVEGAARAGTIAIVPEVTIEPLEALVGSATRAGAIFQLSLRHRDDRLAEILERVADAGYSAVCVTADAPVVGVRRRDRRNRFNAGTRLVLGNFPSVEGPSPTFTGSGPARPPMSWDELGAVLAASDLPFAVKGVLTAEDARAARTIGAAAVYVSNHGGRQLDGAPATFDQLAEVVDEVGDECAVAFDGGVRTGVDAVKALAVGARVVLVGRPAAWGLAVAGADGVARTLEILHEELVTTMALLGAADLAALDRSMLQPAATPATVQGDEGSSA